MDELKKRWTIKEPAPQEFKDQFADLHPLVADLLFHRGLKTQKEIDEFLNPDYGTDLHDPFLFSQMQAAVDRVNEAIGADQKIVVHGDYDADGIGGAVILVSTLRYLGAKHVEVYLPDREKEGYGVNENTVNYLHKQGTNLIITCDCGISNVKEVGHARSLGVDVIVTDHHTIPPELPDAIILHPKIEGEAYPFHDLAGGGVAFKLAQGLLQVASKDADKETVKKHAAFQKWLLDMVAISTIADMVPLIGENRTLVKYGLVVLAKARRPGIKAILENAGILPVKYGKELHATAYHVGFVIGPRLNAAGRMDHANAAFEAIIEEDPAEAKRLADILEQNNRDRQELTKKMLSEALKQIGKVDPDEASVLFAHDPSWSMGVVGLIASRVMDKYHKPVFILAELNGKIAGSGRSIEGFDCVDALQDSKDLLEKFGGHARACGFTLADNDKFDELKKRFNAFARANLTKEQLQPLEMIDAEVNVSDITWEFFEDVEKFMPFGMANPQPKFISKAVEVVEVSTVGADNQHLRLSVKHDKQIIRKCIAFGKGKWMSKLAPGSKIDLVYNVEVNEWNGNRELQLKVIDLKLSE